MADSVSVAIRTVFGSGQEASGGNQVAHLLKDSKEKTEPHD